MSSELLINGYTYSISYMYPNPICPDGAYMIHEQRSDLYPHRGHKLPMLRGDIPVEKIEQLLNLYSHNRMSFYKRPDRERRFWSEHILFYDTQRDLVNEITELISQRVANTDSEGLLSLKERCALRTSSNCWWLEYGVSQIVSELVEGELFTRSIQ